MKIYFLFLFSILGCSTQEKPYEPNPYLVVQFGDVESSQKVHELNNEHFSNIRTNDCQGGGGRDNTCKNQYIMCNTFGGMIPYDICYIRFDDRGTIVPPGFEDQNLNTKPAIELTSKEVKQPSGEYHYKFSGPMAQKLYDFLKIDLGATDSDPTKKGKNILCKLEQVKNHYTCEFNLSPTGLPILK